MTKQEDCKRLGTISTTARSTFLQVPAKPANGLLRLVYCPFPK